MGWLGDGKLSWVSQPWAPEFESSVWSLKKNIATTNNNDIFSFWLQITIYLGLSPLAETQLSCGEQFFDPANLSFGSGALFWGLQVVFLSPQVFFLGLEQVYWLRPSEVRTLETWLSISSCNAMGWKQLILGKSSICNLPVRGVMGMGWVRVEGRLRGSELEQREAFRPEVVARDFG